MPNSLFERTIAFRYLLGARGQGGGFLRFITVAAIGGVAVGTAALLVALAIVRGFSTEIHDKVVGFGQHVQVESYLGDPLSPVDTLAQQLAAFEGVEHVVPAILEFALFRTRGEQGPAIDGALLWGTSEGVQPFVANRMTQGDFSFVADAADRTGIVLGDELAQRVGASLGTTLTAYATRNLSEGARPRATQFHVAGIFNTGLADFDARFAYTSLEAARRFFDYAPDEVTRFDLVLNDISQSNEVAQVITSEIGPPVFARSIYEVFRHLFAWVSLQESIIPVVISVLVVVAAFNIIGTLLMMTLDKARDIGILLAMGASRRSVRRLFLWLGFFIGVIGSGLGAAIALGFAIIQLRYGVIPLPEEAYYISTAPVELRAIDFFLVPALAIMLCTLAAYFPARAAARLEPIRTIRFGA